MNHQLLGIDVGSSSIKVSVVDSATGKTLATAQSPSEEMPMQAAQSGWAEQDPEMWWHHTMICIKKVVQQSSVNAKQIVAIGISYQMHGLVVVGKDHKPLRS